MGGISREERLKYEIAGELGLLDKLKQVGWAGLSAKDSGRVGGMLAAQLRQLKKDE